MKHIVLVTTSFPEGVPGSESAGSFVADFAVSLSEYCRVTVVAPGLNGGREDWMNGLSVRRYQVSSLPLSLLNPCNPVHWPAIAGAMTAGRKALRRLCEEQAIDHIFALWVFPSGYWAFRESRKRGIPYSVWALGSDIWVLSKIPGMRTILKKIVLGSAMSFADGYLLKRDVEALSGWPCEFLASTRDIPALPSKRLREEPPYRLAFLGRWHPNKGVDILLESLALLKAKDWEKIEEIRIFGGGPLMGRVMAGCQELARAGRPVTVGGYLDKTEAAALLAWADYVLLPSRVESIPVIFSDAMKNLCPVIATPVGDLPLLITKYEMGIIAAQAEAVAFSRAISLMLTRPPILCQQGLIEARAAFDLHAISRSFYERIR